MKTTPHLPGMQLKKARAKITRKCQDEGGAGMKSLFGKWLDFSPLKSKRKRVYDMTTTFMLFLLQILGGFSCADAVGVLCVSKAAKGGKHPSPGTGGYCQARMRLELAALKEVAKRLVHKMSGRMKTFDSMGFEVVVADGTGEDMPDTKRNRKRYPAAKERMKGTAFPQLRMECLFGASAVCVQMRLKDKPRLKTGASGNNLKSPRRRRPRAERMSFAWAFSF